MKVSIKNAPNYKWGDNCDGWHLLDSQQLSVIQERMPPGTREFLHYHQESQQVFYILDGQATFILNEEELRLEAGESLSVPAGTAHQIQNLSSADLHFLVISHPKSHGDRIHIK